MPRWYYNLAISGCSYSQGEFSHVGDEYKITHRGLSCYLECNNYQTINVGQNGLSNRNALKNLASIQNLNVLHYLLIKTDPVRDLLINQLEAVDNNIDKRQWDLWLKWWDQHHDWYKLADDYDKWLAKQMQTQLAGQDVWIVGGLCSLNPDPYYTNGIKVLWPSWINEFTNEPADFQWDDVEWLADNLPNTTKQQTIDVINKIIKKNDARYEHEWFAKDGQHPDRHGHKLLYDKIVSDIIKDE